MLVPSSLDASVCLTCHVRRVLRRVASQTFTSPTSITRATFHQKPASRLAEPQHEPDGDDVATPIPRFSMAGGQRRRRNRNDEPREPRFKETTATLPIASMNKETNIIVLRDLPKKEDRKKEESRTLSTDQAVPEYRPTLTAGDVGNQRPLSQAEVEAAIDASKFANDENVVTRRKYDAKVVELSKAYSVAQLRKYISSQRKRGTLKGLYFEDKLRRADLSASSLPKVTSWTPIHTPKKAPMERTKERKLIYGARMAAEDIVKYCWGVEIDDAAIAPGHLEIYLSEDQLNLWLNCTSEAVQKVQPSSRFYQNSTLQLHASDRLIRIRGPQSEAQAMAYGVHEAFEQSSHATIELATLHALWSTRTPLVDFSHLFNGLQLKRVMSLTNTCITYDLSNKRLDISAFVEQGVRDALRLLVSFLPLPSQVEATTSVHTEGDEACFIMPHTATKALPFSHQAKKFGRMAKSVPSNAKTDAKKTTKEDADQKDPSSRPFPAQIMEDVLSHLPEPHPVAQGMHNSRSYWQPTAMQMPWQARLGHILQPMMQFTPTTFDPKRSAAVDSIPLPRSHAFSPHFPSHLPVLKHFTHVSYLRPAPTDPGSEYQAYFSPPPVRRATQLVAKLHPSPLTSLGVLPCYVFPPIEMIFEQQENQPEPDRTEKPSQSLRFVSMQALLRSQLLAVRLPSYPTDVHMTRHQILRSRYTENDLSVSEFISEVLASARDGTSNLRAPSTVDLKMPSWAGTHPPSEDSRKFDTGQRHFLNHLRAPLKKDIEVKYLFAGFEVRERGDFETAKGVVGAETEKLRVDVVEGGASGGRSLQVSVIAKRAGARSPNTDDEPLGVVSQPVVDQAKSQSDLQTRGVVSTTLKLVDTIRKIWDGVLIIKPQEGPVSRVRRRGNRLEAQTKWAESRASKEQEQAEAGEKNTQMGVPNAEDRDGLEGMSDTDVLDALDSMDAGYQPDDNSVIEGLRESYRDSVRTELDEGLAEEVGTLSQGHKDDAEGGKQGV